MVAENGKKTFYKIQTKPSNTEKQIYQWDVRISERAERNWFKLYPNADRNLAVRDISSDLGKKMVATRPNGSHKFVADSAKTRVDGEVKAAEFETFPDRIEWEDEDSEGGHPTGLGDMEVGAGYEKFGVAEVSEKEEVTPPLKMKGRATGL